MKKNGDKKKFIGARIDREAWERFRAEALANGRSVSGELRWRLEQTLVAVKKAV